MDKYFKIYWKDGNCETLTGLTIKDSFTAAGYGSGALASVDYYKEIYPDVKIEIRYKINEKRGVTLICNVMAVLDDISIDTIWDSVWKAAYGHEVECRNIYIYEDFYNNRSYTRDILAMNVRNLSYTIYEQDKFSTNIISMTVYPLSDKAIGYSLDMAVNQTFPDMDVKNGVVQIHDSIHGFNNVHISENLVTFGNKEAMLAYEDIRMTHMAIYKTYFFVLDHESLKSTKLEIFCDVDLMPHIIGKGGRNVNRLKEKLHEKGFTNVKRIEVKEVIS